MRSSLQLILSTALFAGVLAAGAALLLPEPRGDLNGDGIVNYDDLKLVIAHLGTRAGQPGFDPRADVNGDGVVDTADVSAELHLLEMSQYP
jgi:dockerin type I repeat protein